MGGNTHIKLMLNPQIFIGNGEEKPYCISSTGLKFAFLGMLNCLLLLILGY